VSREYGSGGAKRQRTIETAVAVLRLPSGIVHPRLRRPVYAAAFVRNLQDVALTNAIPLWAIEPSVSGADYCASALVLWRRRWLHVAQRRGKLSGAGERSS